MIKIEVDEFTRNLNLLSKFIETDILKVDGLLLTLQSINEQASNRELQDSISAYKSMRGYRKKFNYSAIVILLYGYFENFIERIAEEYVKAIAAVAENFEQLPSKIRENHCSKSRELEKKLNLDKYKNLTKDQIIANLSSCQNIQSKEFTLNVEAYSMHNANFRYHTIDGIFADVGVQKINRQIINENAFSSYLQKIDDKSTDLQTGKSKIFIDAARLKLEQTLNELAQRRNQIAHGAEVDDILSPEILKTKYIDFLRQYAQSLEQVLQASLSSFEKTLIQYELKNYIKIGSPFKIWQKGYVPGFSNVSIDIKLKIAVGDEVIVEISIKKSKEYKKVKILEIHVDKKTQDFIELSTLPLSFTLKLDQKIKENHVVFVKK